MIDLSTFDLSALGLDWLNLRSLDVRFVIFVGLFLGTLLAFEGLRQLLSRGERQDEAKSRRMRMMKAGVTTEEILQILKPPARKSGLEAVPFFGDVPHTLRQAGLTVRPEAFFGSIIAGAMIFAVAGSQVINPLIAIALAVVFFLIVPPAIVRHLRSRRVNAFVRQLPDALERMARGLRVGHPLNTTLASVANEMSDPIGSEFGIVVDQVAYGDDLADAMRELAERIDVEDMHYLAVSVGIQHGTGGDLAAILDTLSRVIRDRAAMRQKIKAISAESRLSAIFLSCIPIFIFLFMSITTPSYYNGVRDDPMFVPMLGIIAAFIAVNAILLRKLVRFRF
jgi:tight adherence protein B